MREPDRRDRSAGAGQPAATAVHREAPVRVRVRVPATTANLGPGFDTLGMALALYNYFELETAPQGCHVEAVGTSAERIPVGEDNLVVRAARAVWERAGLPPTGWRVRLEASIPFGSGLGSSASAIVGGAVAANALAGGPLSAAELLLVAAELEGHADNVTPALLGGFTVVAQGCAADRDGHGDIRWVRLPVRGLEAVLAIPAIQLPTHQSRRLLPQQVSMQDAVFNVSRACLLVGALTTGDLHALAGALEDRLHQPYRASAVPGFVQVVHAARAAGAVGAVLSGAGPAVLALAPEGGPVAEIGEAMANAFYAAGVKARWLALGFDDTGAAVETPGGA